MARADIARLREGFTTGTAATAAALAALTFLLHGTAPAHVATPLLPSGEQPRAWLDIPVSSCAPGPAPELAGRPEVCPPGAPCAHARVRKDGGDDPDATNGALITSSVFLQRKTSDARIRIEGGPGVGRVTLPGLPVRVGEPAINPSPQAQIRYALENALAQLPADAHPALTVVISVPGGEELARHTLNSRLGIRGGISILGTQGTVRPYSHAAWRATVAQGLSVAQATGCRTICLSTGRRSERLLMRRYPDLPDTAFVQAADFARFSLAAAGRLPLERLVWGCFFGKLAKLAQGLASTHARAAPLDMKALAALCGEAGAACAPEVARCVTAAQALELLMADPAGGAAIAAVGARAQATARRFAARPVTVHLFHTDGWELLSL